MRGSKHKNTRRENRLEELGRVDAERAYSKKGKRNLRDEKSRIVRELKADGGSTGSKYITKKKSNNTKAIEEIENLYSNGFLSKKECVRAKVKILKLPSASESLCDNVKVKVVHKDDMVEI